MLLPSLSSLVLGTAGHSVSYRRLVEMVYSRWRLNPRCRGLHAKPVQQMRELLISIDFDPEYLHKIEDIQASDLLRKMRNEGLQVILEDREGVPVHWQ